MNKNKSLLNMVKIIRPYPAGIPSRSYLLKVNNRNTRTRCGICSTLIKTSKRSDIFIVHFKLISRIVLVFLLLALKM